MESLRRSGEDEIAVQPTLGSGKPVTTACNSAHRKSVGFNRLHSLSTVTISVVRSRFSTMFAWNREFGALTPVFAIFVRLMETAGNQRVPARVVRAGNFRAAMFSGPPKL